MFLFNQFLYKKSVAGQLVGSGREKGEELKKNVEKLFYK